MTDTIPLGQLVVRLKQPVKNMPVGTELGYRDVADAIAALGSYHYFDVVRDQAGNPIPPLTPEEIEEAQRAAQRRAKSRRLILGADFDPLWDRVEGIPSAEELTDMQAAVDAVADVPPRVEAVEQALPAIASRVDVAEKAPARVSAYVHGVRANASTSQNAALHAAFQAAEAMGGGATIELPPGVITIDGTFSLAGYSSGMVGTGNSTIVGGYGAGNGTVLKAINQTGPVLDFNGFKSPRGQKGRVLFADFAIEGDGTSGVAKRGISLYTGTNASSVDLARITISKTGGSGLYVKDFYLSDFHSVSVFTPVDCVANDVPYVLLEGANGNRYYGLGIRSTNHDGAVADCPPSGALRLITGSTYQHHRSVFYGPWFENLHLPSGAAAIVSQANAITWNDVQYFDCYKLAGATDTAYARFESPATQNYGGNQWYGLVEGKGSIATVIDTGIVVSQSANTIIGPKGHGGNNIVISPGVEWTYAMLAGAFVAGNNVGIIDNSGTTTNTLIDAPMGVWALGGRTSRALISLNGLEQSSLVSDLGTTAGNIGLNMNFGHNIFALTLGGNTTITAVVYTAARVGRELTVIVAQDATGGRTLSWPSSVKFAGGTAPTLSTAPGKVDTFTFVYASGGWRETSRAIGT